MDFDILYTKAGSIIGNKTPLKADCGLICGKNCCKENKETGMLLFPNEKTDFKIISGNSGRIAVCDGKCDRQSRPLSCKIFPFFPVINQNGKIEAVLDYRGYSVCPMIKNENIIKFDRRFIKAVEKVGKLLYKNPECKDFIERISVSIREEKEIINKFTKEEDNDNDTL